MKKILSFLVVAALVVSCSKTDEVQPSSYIITGHTTTASTRVEMVDDADFGQFGFFTFSWSEGDKVWVGSQQSDPLTESSIYGGDADFALRSAPQSGDQVIYNMKANASAEALTAVVSAEQDASKSLGENGAFGQTELNGTWFELEYKTNFVNFNIKALPSGATLKSIRLDAGNAIVAGSATWNGSAFGAVSNGSSTIELKVNKNTVSSSGYITMVILPPADMTIPSATITYELEIQGAKKYYTQTLGSKTFQTGEMARVTVDLSKVELYEKYELRTLTFEDADYVGSEGSTYWSDFIPTSGQYGNGNGRYSWYDEDNTELFFSPDSPKYPGMGGHAISNYTGSDLSQGDYMHDLQAYNVTGGANGSENFCVHFGYIDDSGMGMMNNLLGFEFEGGVARTIESMYVTNTTYVYNIMENGDGWMVPVGGVSDDCWLKIVAYGYDDSDADDDEYTKSVEFTLWENGQGVKEWTKWDLSGLGEVVEVRFNLIGSDELYASGYGLGAPGYFAYDDVTVRF
ncbi:MAG: DUF4465 domain-containing protein [Alistipes sp.]|nr:DUF4465 domain-containing protein [Alistipes sp.]MBQ5922353.1 DUF4465 domain-containing protein [Alistipes sp.]